MIMHKKQPKVHGSYKYHKSIVQLVNWLLIPICNCFRPSSFKYRIRQNFRGGKLLRLCTKHTIHWKTFMVHQAHAIMYCTQQMIQGENFRDWLENRESFPPRKFCHTWYCLKLKGLNLRVYTKLWLL